MSGLVSFAHTIEGKHPVKIDVDRLIETRLLIWANSGGGKSFAVRKLLESTHGRVQQIILDSEGEFNSLRSRFEYVYVAKGEKVEPDIATAGKLAETLLELGVSAIVDFYELGRLRPAFVRAFLEALMSAPKRLWHPVLIIVDEAHRYAPEQSKSESLAQVVELEAAGRKRDFCGALATQRLAKLVKDAVAECQNKIIGLANMKDDRVRAAGELGISIPESLILRDLEPGEVFVLGPAFRVGTERVKEPLLVKVDPVETPHGRKARRWKGPKRDPARIASALSKLAELPKRVHEERQTMESLLSQVNSLKTQVRTLERQMKDKPSGMPKAQVEQLLKASQADLHKKFNIELQSLHRRITEAFKAVKIPRGTRLELDGFMPPNAPADPKQVHIQQVSRVVPIRPEEPVFARSAPILDEKLSPTATAILRFLGERAGSYFSSTQIAVRVRYSRRSSSFTNALRDLKRMGLISQLTGGDYGVLPQDIPTVQQKLGVDLSVPTRDRPEDWLPKLQPTARRMLEELLAHRTQYFSREDLSQRTGYSLTSSSFVNAIRDLGKLGLLEHGRDKTVRLGQSVAEEVA